jgi:hypothetical protein
MDQWKRLLASILYACLSSRKITAVTWQFEQQRELWVSTAREQNERTPMSTEHDELYEQVINILEIGKLTKAGPCPKTSFL